MSSSRPEHCLELIRDGGEDEGSGVFQDDSVQLLRHYTATGRVRKYTLRCRRVIPHFGSNWFVSVHFRDPGVAELKVNPDLVYEDGSVRLVRFGTAPTADYILTLRRPGPDDRHGDPRFATDPRPHPIENVGKHG